MKKHLFLLATVLLLGTSQAYADDCQESANSEHSACVEAAGKLVNDVEIEDAKAVCTSRYSSALQACDDKETGKKQQPAEEQQQ